MEDGDILQPGENISPIINSDEIKQLVNDIYGFVVLNITELNGYDDKNYLVTFKTDEKNQDINDDGYVLKIINTLDSKRPDLYDAQTSLLLHLRAKKCQCPKPVPTTNGLYFTTTKLKSGEHIVRLLEFIEGTILLNVRPSQDLFYEVGKYLAHLDLQMQDFEHPIYDNYKSVWMLQSIPELRHFIFALKNEEKRKMVLEVIEEFEYRVLPLLDTFEKGLIHADFNEQNIIVEGEETIKAVIDFGDSHVSCYLFEVAICMTYMILQSKDIHTGGDVLAGYFSVRKIPEHEFQLLRRGIMKNIVHYTSRNSFSRACTISGVRLRLTPELSRAHGKSLVSGLLCVATRLCQSMVLGAYTNLKNPDNSYVLRTSVNGWTILEQILNEPEEKLLKEWKIIAENP